MLRLRPLSKRPRITSPCQKFTELEWSWGVCCGHPNRLWISPKCFRCSPDHWPDGTTDGVGIVRVHFGGIEFKDRFPSNQKLLNILWKHVRHAFGVYFCLWNLLSIIEKLWIYQVRAFEHCWVATVFQLWWIADGRSIVHEYGHEERFETQRSPYPGKIDSDNLSFLSLMKITLTWN